jgi:hypothetical protein
MGVVSGLFGVTKVSVGFNQLVGSEVCLHKRLQSGRRYSRHGSGETVCEMKNQICAKIFVNLGEKASTRCCVGFLHTQLLCTLA